MTAAQLRNSILQEAISGRLVPQDPKDEPASILLNRIVSNVNETLPLKKKKSVELILEPEDIVPVKGWVYFYIKDLFDTTSGGTPIKGHPEYYNGNIPWVRSGELNSLYLYDSELCISEAGLKNSSAKYFPIDTVVIAMYGATIGKTSIFKRSMTTNQAICGIFPVDGILPEYIYYFLQSKKQEYCSIAFGSGQPNISQEKIKNTIFPLPPLVEQQRIVAKLEELLPIVEQYGKAQTELDELNAALPVRLRQSILQEAISGRLVNQDSSDGSIEQLEHNIADAKQQLLKEGKLKAKDLVVTPIPEEDLPFDIPSTWRWYRLGELAFERMGKTPPRGESKFWLNPQFPWVSISDMKDYGHVKSTKEGVSSYAAQSAFRQISPKGSLLMSFKLTVGRTSILDIDAYHNEAIITIQPYFDQDCAFRNYLFYILPLIANMGDSKDAIKGKTLNSTSLYNLLIPLPPIEEQKRIVAKIEETFAALKF